MDSQDQPTVPVELNPQPEQQPAAKDAGRTLGIVGFIVSFFVGLIGLILSIVALVRSKKSGYKNGLALAGIIIGALSTVASAIIATILLLVVLPTVVEVTDKCEKLGSNSVYVNGQSYPCTSNTRSSGDDTSTASGNSTSIAGTAVTLAGSTVTSTCYTFTAPADYLLSPNAKQCQAELRADNGTSSGIALTAIFVKAQIGSATVEDFITKMEDQGASKIEAVTINGVVSAVAAIEDSNGLEQTSYFVPDTSGKFKASNGVITSYLIYGPTGSEELKANLETVVDSFKIK